ncbi:MAG TPA: hypothetical protein VF450_13105 [Noviherbaspirillum sp.]
MWFDPSKFHTVHVVSGSSYPVHFCMNADGSFKIIVEEENDWDGNNFVDFDFTSPSELQVDLDKLAFVLPRNFMDSLAKHYADGSSHRAMPAPMTWPVTIEDVIQLQQRWYVVSWSLSYESADTDNSDSFESLTEAIEFLRETGAMMALPGNSGSIAIGSYPLYGTHFTSKGIDRGDSHINPTMKATVGALYDQILAFEKQQTHSIQPVAEACHVA